MAAALELHCGLARLRLVDGARGAVDMLHPYPEDVFDPVHWAKGGIYPLIPYSNRVANFRHHTDAAFLPLGFARPLQDNERADPPRRLVNGTMTDYLGGWNGRASVELPTSPPRGGLGHRSRRRVRPPGGTPP